MSLTRMERMHSDRERRECEPRTRYLSNDGRHPLLWYGATSVDKADSMHHTACGSEEKNDLAMCMAATEAHF